MSKESYVLTNHKLDEIVRELYQVDPKFKFISINVDVPDKNKPDIFIRLDYEK